MLLPILLIGLWKTGNNILRKPTKYNTRANIHKMSNYMFNTKQNIWILKQNKTGLKTHFEAQKQNKSKQKT